MIDLLQKKNKLEKILVQMLEGVKCEDVQRDIRSLLMADTNNGKMYKYRAFNEYALSNLRDGTLYCAVPSTFNDPFDCKLGFEIQSSIEIEFAKHFEGIEECLRKFIAVINKQLSIEECSKKEKKIINRWFACNNLCGFIEQLSNNNFTDYELKEILVTNFNILIELLCGYTSDDELEKQLTNAGNSMNRLFDTLSREERKKLINENVTIAAIARSYGIHEDVDEISLLTLMCQLLDSNQVDNARKISDEFSRVNCEWEKIIDEQYRVGCLCTDYKNRLMWSHYAEGHKGFCIEYDFNIGCDYMKDILILPVVYSRERIKFPWEIALVSDKVNKSINKEAGYKIIRSLLTKDEVWNYENEWRIILAGDSSSGNIKMPPVSCIYIGALCNQENKKTLIEIARKLDVPIKQMVVDRGEYILHAQMCEKDYTKEGNTI